MAFDPVENTLKWILILGRLIGVVPIKIAIRKSSVELRFRWHSFSACHSLLIGITTLLIFVPNLFESFHEMRKGSNILQQLLAFEVLSFRLTVVFVYAYFIVKAKRIVEIIKQWKVVTEQLDFMSKDTGYPKFCAYITVVVLGIGITENILSEISKFSLSGKSVEGLPFLQKMYILGTRGFADWVPYHPLTTIFFLYVVRFSAYAWNFGDIFLIVLCRAVAFKFHQIDEEIQFYSQACHRVTDKIINGVIIDVDKTSNANAKIKSSSVFPLKVTENEKIAKKRLEMVIDEKCGIPTAEAQVLEMTCSQLSKLDVDTFWKQTRNKIFFLLELSHEITRFVEPLLMACYGCNIFLIIIRTLQFLHGSKNEGEGENIAYVYTSSIQFLLRVILVTYHASQVYHSTEKIVRTIESTPDMYISTTTNRLERMLERHPVGVTIFGAVRVTKKFFISIVSFMFTTEIVLLQAMSSGNSHP